MEAASIGRRTCWSCAQSGHRIAERVQEQVLVASLALTIDRVPRRKLGAAWVGTAQCTTYDALEAVGLAGFESAGGQRRAGVCVSGVPDAAGAGSKAGRRHQHDPLKRGL